MQQRFDIMKDAPDTFRALVALETYVRGAGIEPRLLHLIKIRASQINGCAYCVDIHVRDARNDGMTAQWLDLIVVWKESPLYDERERALLGFVEEVTDVAATGISDSAYSEIARFFDTPTLSKLLVAIGMINVWNRLSLAQRLVHPVDRTSAAA